MPNKNGYATLVMLLVALVLGALWFAYIWNGNWFGPKSGTGQAVSGSDTGQNLNAQQQIDVVRDNMKNLQDKRDQEIYKELAK